MTKKNTVAAAMSAAVVALGGATAAKATTITFDDVDTSGQFLSYTSQGYTVSAPAGEYVIDAADDRTSSGTFLLTGFQAGTAHSTLTIASEDSNGFYLNSFDATQNSPNNYPALYEVKGYAGDQVVYDLTALLGSRDDYQLTTIDNDFSSTLVTRVDLLASSDSDFAVDNIIVNAPTPAAPEPNTWALMMAGVGLAGAALRRWRAASPLLA